MELTFSDDSVKTKFGTSSQNKQLNVPSEARKRREWVVEVICIRYKTSLGHDHYEVPTNANETVRNRDLTRCERSLSIVREEVGRRVHLLKSLVTRGWRQSGAWTTSSIRINLQTHANPSTRAPLIASWIKKGPAKTERCYLHHEEL